MSLFSMAAWMLALLYGGVPHLAAAQDGPPFPRIANALGNLITPTATSKDIADAARYSLIIAGFRGDWHNTGVRRKLEDKVAEVRARNPRILILGPTVSIAYAGTWEKDFPQDGWLLQADGKRIKGWPGTEMINLRKEDVLDWLAQQAKLSATMQGVDGVFVDNMTPRFDAWAANIATHEPYTVDADGDGKPDDPKWLNQEWGRAKMTLARKIREAIGPDKYFVANTTSDAPASYLNGALLEDYMDYVLDGKKTWDSVFGEYQRWMRQARPPALTTLLGSSGVTPPFNAQKRPQSEQDELLNKGRARVQRMRFGLTTALMGDGYFAYDLNTRWRGQRWWYPEYDAPLGYPKGDARKQSDGTWRRDFDGGVVIVNPTRQTATVRFAKDYQDVSSSTKDRTFTIPAQDGRIFLPVKS